MSKQENITSTPQDDNILDGIQNGLSHKRTKVEGGHFLVPTSAAIEAKKSTK